MSEQVVRDDSAPARAPLAASLRMLGALSLVAAAGTFLWQNWSGMGDVARYGLLWAQTALVWGAGWFCGVRLAAHKAARTLLGLVFAVTPMHFAVVGGMLYSRLPLDAPPARTSASLLWIATSLPEALGVAALAAVSLGVMSRLSLRVFDRQLAARDFWACSIPWAALLVPVRDPAVTLVLAAVATRLALAVRGPSRTGSHTVTWARSAMWAGSLLLAGRTALLYGLDASVWATAALFVPAAAAHIAGEPALPAAVRAPLRRLCYLVLALAWPGPAYLLAERFGVSPKPLLLASAWLALSLGRGFEREGAPSRSRGLPSLSIAVWSVGLAVDAGWLSTCCAFGASALLLVHGAQCSDRAALTAGALAFTAVVGIRATESLSWQDLWQSWNLAGLGLGCVLVAALLERRPNVLRDAWRGAQRRWDQLEGTPEAAPDQSCNECETSPSRSRNLPTRALS